MGRPRLMVDSCLAFQKSGRLLHEPAGSISDVKVPVADADWTSNFALNFP
jgi:hypothetical protein